MAEFKLTSKKMQIDKAQATTVGAIATAVFITVFSLVSTKSLWDQLETNIEAVNGLVESYKQFTNSSTNILGGNPTGTGEKDGDNARLVLDALPSKYDFPALTTSIEKLITDKKLKIDSITGTDDEVAQAGVKNSGNPKPADMPFQISVSGSYASIQDLFTAFERSIRPFQATKIQLKGGASDMKLTMDAKTYYLPEKSLDIKKVDVK